MCGNRLAIPAACRIVALEDPMSKTLTTAAVAATMVAGYALIGGMTPAATTAPAMAASEHIAHMAMAGSVHANHAMDEMKWAAARAQAAPAAANANLPADDMGVMARLAASTRKSECVKSDVGGSPMRAWVVYPDRRDKAPVVVVIQEIC